MKETIHTSSKIVIFGRVVDDLTVSVSDADKAAGKDPKFARAYGFTFDGIYLELASPVLFLVDGDGEEADDIALPGPNPRDKKFYADLRAWTVDRSDETVRLDVDSGKFENLLPDTGGDGGAGVSGARVSGARVSGARVSGARVSGARVSGARVSGARGSGARGDASD